MWFFGEGSQLNLVWYLCDSYAKIVVSNDSTQSATVNFMVRVANVYGKLWQILFVDRNRAGRQPNIAGRSRGNSYPSDYVDFSRRFDRSALIGRNASIATWKTWTFDISRGESFVYSDTFARRFCEVISQ